jgi:hypothetical protein
MQCRNWVQDGWVGASCRAGLVDTELVGIPPFKYIRTNEFLYN